MRLATMAPMNHQVPGRIALVLGAGGPSGGRFIDAALAELGAICRFEPVRAGKIVGTSAGAFTAARTPPPDRDADLHWAFGLHRLANGLDWRRRWYDRPATLVRLAGGRIAARVSPRNRPAATYQVPAGPYHPGAVVVSTAASSGSRVVHHLISVFDPGDAIKASAAVPFRTGPVLVDGSAQLDGALYSPTNADLCPPDDHDLLIVIAPMAPADGGGLLGRLHRSQLRSELHRWTTGSGLKPAVVVVPQLSAPRSQRLDTAADAGRNSVWDLVDRAIADG